MYFPARASRYGRIRPQVFREPEVLQAFGQAAEQAPARGIQLNAWVIGMFQPWMARAYPDTAVENAFGARSFAQTCPASPDVQEYLATLVADLSDQYPVHSAMLERAGHPDFAYGWVRERILIDLDPWTRFLAGMCFCDNCLTAARTHGVDAVEVRAGVARELRDRLASNKSLATWRRLSRRAARRTRSSAATWKPASKRRRAWWKACSGRCAGREHTSE